MRGFGWILAILMWIVAAMGCSARASRVSAKAVPTTKTDNPRPSIQKPESVSTDQPPLGMADVLAETDSALAQQAGWNFSSPPLSEGGDRSSAPYLFVAGTDQDRESLPLRSTSARVSVTGVFAQVEVTQVYQNRGTTPIEAVYVFPASTRAAVSGMRMTIGPRVITAKIEKRDKAREQYGAAKQQGKRASLLEQERSNVFTMSVANIMPGDVIKTELSYSELIVPEDGTYTFVYPTVVGPRNPQGSDPKAHGWVAGPHLSAGTREPHGFDLQVQLRSPIPFKTVASPSHPIRVTYPSSQVADVALTGPGGGNRDFVLHYKLRGDQIQTGTLTYDHGGEKFFLMMMEPPQRIAASEVMPREYIFVVDVSGSMRGFPLDTAKQLMGDLLSRLSASEYFNVVAFAGHAGVLSSRSLPATPSNVQAAIGSLGSLAGAGGTNLMDALRTSYALPRPVGTAMSRSLMVITDGYVTVEPQAYRFIRQHLGEANVFSFGIGSSVNRALIEGVARAGRGSPFVVLEPGEAAGKAVKFRQYVESPLLTNIQLKFQGVDAYDVIPAKLPDLLADRPLIAFGKYRGSGQGVIEVVGSRAAGPFKQQLQLDTQAASAQNRPLRSLWARSWVEELTDQHAALGGGNPSTQRAIEHLGLTYGLLTQFTSFVAIDSQVVNADGKSTAVRQPLPMPQGVANTALATPTQAKMVLLEGSAVVLLTPVEFEHAKHKLDPSSLLLVERVIDLMRARPDLRLGIYGHCADNEGSGAAKLKLSKQRAEAVAAYLTAKGIDPKRLQVDGFGDQRPKADDATAEGRAKNRRVEFKILE